jgi:hypothetical protein
MKKNGPKQSRRKCIHIFQYIFMLYVFHLNLYFNIQDMHMHGQATNTSTVTHMCIEFQKKKKARKEKFESPKQPTVSANIFSFPKENVTVFFFGLLNFPKVKRGG